MLFISLFFYFFYFFAYTLDGQAIAIKLSKQITKVTDSMRKAISCHNAIQSAVSLSLDEAKDPSSELYSNLQFPSSLTHVVPDCTRRTAIELRCLKERCEEEISLLTSEMERLVAFIHNQMKVLATEINKEVTADTNTLALGLKSLFLSKRAEFVKQLQTLKRLWDDSVSIHLDQN